MKIVAKNRQAYHYYEILGSYEAGIKLTGNEVKSCRLGKIDLRDSFARIDKNEVYLYNMYVAPYEQGRLRDYDPRARRKLLLHREEIKRLIGQVSQKGLTLIPLELYFKESWAKVKLSLAKRKKIYDKREILRRRAIEREMRRSLKR